MDLSEAYFAATVPCGLFSAGSTDRLAQSEVVEIDSKARSWFGYCSDCSCSRCS
jgi:hypothetical protein